MQSGFIENLYTLINDASDAAFMQLKKSDRQFAEQYTKWCDLFQKIETISQTKEALSERDKEELSYFLELSNTITQREENAVYIRGWADCITTLRCFGYIK